MNTLTDKTIALAGVFQAAALVNQVATKGIIDEHELTTAISSLLNQNPASTLNVFGDYENLRTGFYTLIAQLNDAQVRDMNIARYVISMLHLQNKLRKRPDMLNTIASRIARAKEQSEIFGLTHSNVLANLAGIYSDTLSLIPPKIMVSGESSYLSNPTNADKIRAILLSGIRAAVLWQQVGGSRWQILFKRKQFIKEARRILDNEMGRLH